MAVADVPADVYVQLKDMTDIAHSHAECNDAGNQAISIRGGKQIQLLPNEFGLDSSLLKNYVESQCIEYMTRLEQINGVNDLNLFNTQLYQRVGDAHYAGPILVSPPEHGTVCISANRKSFTYTPHAGYVGWDSFTYTMLTQHGQAGMPRSIFIEVTAN